MRDTTTYDIFKEDLAGNPCWVESIEGLVTAVSEMNKLAASEPCDYFLFCALTGTVVGRLHRQPGVMSVKLRTRQKSELRSGRAEPSVSDTGALFLLNRRDAIRRTIRYEILKEDFEENTRWIESVEGLEQATNRIEELAGNDPSSEYYLYCVQADKLIRRLRRTSPSADVLSSNARQKKAG